MSFVPTVFYKAASEALAKHGVVPQEIRAAGEVHVFNTTLENQAPTLEMIQDLQKAAKTMPVGTSMQFVITSITT